MPVSKTSLASEPLHVALPLAYCRQLFAAHEQSRVAGPQITQMMHNCGIPSRKRKRMPTNMAFTLSERTAAEALMAKQPCLYKAPHEGYKLL